MSTKCATEPGSVNLLILFLGAVSLVLSGCVTQSPNPASTFLEAGQNGLTIPEFRPSSRAPENLDAAVRDLLRFHRLPMISRVDWTACLDPREPAPHAEAVLSQLAQQGIWVQIGPHTDSSIRLLLAAQCPALVLTSTLPLSPDHTSVWVISGWREQPESWLTWQRRGQALAVDATTWKTARLYALNTVFTLAPGDRTPLIHIPALLRSRAQYHEWRSEWELALHAWKEAAQAEPDDSSLQIRIGNAHLRLKQREKAERAYREALALDPRNAAAYNNLAFLLAEEKRSLQEAEELARSAMALTPDSATVIDTLAFTLMQQDHFEEAAAWLERARAHVDGLDEQAENELLIHLAECYLAQNQMHLARQILDQLFARQPGILIPESLKPALAARHPVPRN